MSQTLNVAIAVVGIDIGNNSFHVLVLRKNGRVAKSRPAFLLLPWLIGIAACVGAHHLSRKLQVAVPDGRGHAC